MLEQLELTLMSPSNIDPAKNMPVHYVINPSRVIPSLYITARSRDQIQIRTPFVHLLVSSIVYNKYTYGTIRDKHSSVKITEL